MKHPKFDSMFPFQFHVNVVECRNDGVWVATSDEIKGLTVEEASLEACLATLFDVGANCSHTITDSRKSRSPIRFFIRTSSTTWDMQKRGLDPT